MESRGGSTYYRCISVIEGSGGFEIKLAVCIAEGKRYQGKRQENYLQRNRDRHVMYLFLKEKLKRNKKVKIGNEILSKAAREAALKCLKSSKKRKTFFSQS